MPQLKDRLAQIEARWTAVRPGAWKRVETRALGTTCEVRDSDGRLVCTGVDFDEAAAIAHAPEDIRWLINEVRQVRKQAGEELPSPKVIGKSRHRDVTLATFTVDDTKPKK